jgi:hyaluronate lyase
MVRLTSAVVLALFWTLVCHADPFDTLRLKWRQILIGGERVDESIPEIRTQLAALEERARRTSQTMQKDPEAAALWKDLASDTSSSQITSAWNRLRSMALAWATPGQKLYNDPDLLAAIRQGMSWMEQHRYNARVPQEYANWWDWEIGSPLSIGDLLVLLYDRLTPDELARYAAAVDRFVPDPRMRGKSLSTGANRVWQCQGAALRAIVVKDAPKLQTASDGLLPVFQYVTSGDGFYQDGSFLQHGRHPYTGGYGNALLADMANLLYLLAGSPWDIRDPARVNIFRWVFDSYQPVIYR